MAENVQGFTDEELEQLANGSEFYIHDGIAYCDDWAALAHPGISRGQVYDNNQKRAVRKLDYCQRYIDDLEHQLVCQLKIPARVQNSEILMFESTCSDFYVGMDRNAVQGLPKSGLDIYGVIYGEISATPVGTCYAEGAALVATWTPQLIAVSQGRVLAVFEALPKHSKEEQIINWMQGRAIPVFGAPHP